MVGYKRNFLLRTHSEIVFQFIGANKERAGGSLVFSRIAISSLMMPVNRLCRGR